MGNPEDKLKHARRRKNHIAKDLLSKKYRPKIHEKDEPYDRNKNKKIVLEEDINFEVELNDD